MPGSLKVVIVASEVVPFAKTGGLADVAGALPVALARLGHQVSVMPRYPTIDRAVRSLEKVQDRLAIPMGSQTEGAIWSAKLTSRIPVFFIEHQRRNAMPSIARLRVTTPITPSALPFCEGRFGGMSGTQTPAGHHSSRLASRLIPAYLKTVLQHDPAWASTSSLLTIHNIACQGLFPPEVMEFLQLPHTPGPKASNSTAG